MSDADENGIKNNVHIQVRGRLNLVMNYWVNVLIAMAISFFNLEIITHRLNVVPVIEFGKLPNFDLKCQLQWERHVLHVEERPFQSLNKEKNHIDCVSSVPFFSLTITNIYL